MRHPIDPRLENGRASGPPGECCGFFYVRRKSGMLRLQVSEGCGWDHVSVSLATRCPTWEEMCFVKNLLFLPDEAVMQLHPPRSEYVNYMPFCLHLWRPQSPEEMQLLKVQWGDEWLDEWQSPGAIPLPPSILVGPKQGAAT